MFLWDCVPPMIKIVRQGNITECGYLPSTAPSLSPTSIYNPLPFNYPHGIWFWVCEPPLIQVTTQYDICLPSETAIGFNLDFGMVQSVVGIPANVENLYVEMNSTADASLLLIAATGDEIIGSGAAVIQNPGWSKLIINYCFSLWIRF